MSQPQKAADVPLIAQWSAVLVTRAGVKLLVRPAAPDDSSRIAQFFAGLTQDDLRFRFLTPVAKPSPSFLASLVRVDHVRTEDFLAFVEVDGELELVASAMIAAEPTMERAEVAIAVAPAFKRKGVGWTLLDFVAHDAKARGIKELQSVECRDNRAAIDLEREMGFTASSYPGDATLTLVSKTLTDGGA